MATGVRFPTDSSTATARQVVADALRKVDPVGARAAEQAEGGHAVALPHRRPVRRAAHHAADLAAGHEGQRRLDLVLAARLQQLGEGDAGRVHVDHHALALGEHVRGVRLGDVADLQRLLGPFEVDDLHRAHEAGDPIVRARWVSIASVASPPPASPSGSPTAYGCCAAARSGS